MLTNTAFSQNANIGNAIISCATADGSLAHSLYETKDKFIARVSFSKYRDSNGVYVHDIPLENGNTFSDRLLFLEKKTEVFSAIFKDLNYLEIEFNKNKCGHLENTDHISWYCETDKPTSIGGIKINQIDFSIENQTRVNVVGELKAYYTELGVTTEANSSGVSTRYSSSYTYYPNGNNTACGFKKTN